MKKIIQKHTPGPWTASINPIESPNTDDAGTVWRDSREGATLICCTSKSPGTKQGEANAKLIAAAPEMLDALEEARLQIKYLHKKFQKTGSGNNVLNMIDTIIKKATE